VSADVEAGHLVKPFDIELVPERSFHLLSRPNSPRTREVSVVLDWLLNEAANSSEG
jgi:LysR family glycine cleavage system transcriptional activator